MSKEYDAFVENLRQLLLERLGLKEEQIFFFWSSVFWQWLS